MRASAVMKIMRGNSSSSSSAVAAALLAMIMTMVITRTNCFSINKTITVSSSWCDGRHDDPSCFIGETTDLDSDEFMLDSEFSRRILQATDHLTSKTKDASNPVLCARPNDPECPAGSYGNSKNPQCNDPFNRGCNRIG